MLQSALLVQLEHALTVAAWAGGGARTPVCLARTSARSLADVRPTEYQLVSGIRDRPIYLSRSALDVIIDTLRVRHILEHDIADLQCWFSES
jgi:hypothetical protein